MQMAEVRAHAQSSAKAQLVRELLLVLMLELCPMLKPPLSAAIGSIKPRLSVLSLEMQQHIHQPMPDIQASARGLQAGETAEAQHC